MVPCLVYSRTPQANNLDISSPLGLPIYAEAIEELKDLDIAYSRNVGEIFDSEKIILADDQLMFGSGTNIKGRYAGMSNEKLPHYVKKCIWKWNRVFLSGDCSIVEY